MDSHPSYPSLLPFVTKHPHLSGCVFQVYNDLLLAQRWEDIEIQWLPACERLAIKGTRPETKISHWVVPCNLTESLSLEWLTFVFKELNLSEIQLAIVSDDSSIVYYRLSNGIVKPPS